MEMTHQEVIELHLKQLAELGIARNWLEITDPIAKLHDECQALRRGIREPLTSYLASHPIVEESLGSVEAQMAFSAGLRWQDAAPVLHPLARRGWHISRWLPSFLIVDGPLGGLLRHHESPIAVALKTDHRRYPLLASARDAFNDDLFRRVRNAFGHWSFVWRESDEIELVHFDTGHSEALTLLQAEALHNFTMKVLRALRFEILRPLGDNIDMANKAMQPDRASRHRWRDHDDLDG